MSLAASNPIALRSLRLGAPRDACDKILLYMSFSYEHGYFFVAFLFFYFFLLFFFTVENSEFLNV